MKDSSVWLRWTAMVEKLSKDIQCYMKAKALSFHLFNKSRQHACEKQHNMSFTCANVALLTQKNFSRTCISFCMSVRRSPTGELTSEQLFYFTWQMGYGITYRTTCIYIGKRITRTVFEQKDRNIVYSAEWQLKRTKLALLRNMMMIHDSRLKNRLILCRPEKSPRHGIIFSKSSWKVWTRKLTKHVYMRVKQNYVLDCSRIWKIEI